MSKQSENESRLLRLIYQKMSQIDGNRIWREGMSRTEWATINGAAQNLSKIGVRISGNWIGTDAASRKARSRAIAGLEKRGLVTLHAEWDENITHAKLTPAGLAVFAPKPVTLKPVVQSLDDLDL